MLLHRSSQTFTGADIAELCTEAVFRALRESVEAKTVCVQVFEAAWYKRARGAPATADSDSWTMKP
uniref:AAA ATPase AAA+ lid domain-containing protein n=1 Tax=Peronospora matthiolae TaxID=2874970 RepID=A0AAV1UI05_9STRA